MSKNADPTSLIPMESIMAYMKGVPKEMNQFDFFLGEWETTAVRYRPDGSKIGEYEGEWTAKHLNGGRILFDDFRARMPNGGPEFAYMATLRTYSPQTQRWEMTFLVAHQPQRVTSFRGQWKDGEMHLTGEGATADGKPVLARVRFFDITPESFEWANESSLDGGETWWCDNTISARRKVSRD